MYKANEEYGKVRMNSYIATSKAEKMLNYFKSVGWHECNSLYHQLYKDGISGVFMIFTVGGTGTIRLNEKSYILTAGKGILVPPNTPMEYYTCTGSTWEFYWISMYGLYVLQTTAYILSEQETLFHISNITDCLEIIKHLIYLEDENKFRFELEASQKIYELMQNIIKGLFHFTNNSLSNDFSAKIVAYIEKHYNDTIHIAGLSKTFHISQNQLIRNFQAEIGYTPYEYLKRFRLLKACELLEMTGYTIKEIGKLTGFQNISNFIFQFKTQYAITPYSYRKLYSPLSKKKA